MKTSKFLLYIFFAFIGFTSFINDVKAQGASVDFNVFYNNLSPYGRWMDYPRYGRVWSYNEPGFRPYYTNGHWDFTDYGWTWVSDFDWGWGPFHYGRWEYDDMYGWLWIPGYDWAPAWVAWGEYGGNYGWAPLGYGMNIGMNFSFGAIPYNRWVFGPREYINSPGFYNYYRVADRRMINNVTIINNYNQYRGGGRYMVGPDRYEVERYTHTQIQPRRFDNNVYNRPGNVFGNRNGGNYQNRGADNNGGNTGWSRRGETTQSDNRVFDQQRNNQVWQDRRAQQNSISPNNNPTRQGQQAAPQQRPVFEQRNTQQGGGWGNRGGGAERQSEPRNFGGESRQSNNGGGNRGSESRGGGWGRRG